MRRSRLLTGFGFFLVAAIVATAFIIEFRDRPILKPGKQPSALPRVMLWVWERPTHIASLDTRTTGIAYLAGSIYLLPDTIELRRRVSALQLPRGVYTLPVIRIESDGTVASAPRFDDKAIAVASTIAQLARSTGSNAVQVDYDANESEQPFYRAVLGHLRFFLGPTARIEITAMASWCMLDPWIDSLPIDASIPMLFRMGRENLEIRHELERGDAIRSRLAAHEMGVSLDEPIPLNLDGKRLYVFNPRPWTPIALHRVLSNRQLFH